MDNEGHLHAESIESLREAISRGVTVIMVTGKVGFTCMYLIMNAKIFDHAM